MASKTQPTPTPLFDTLDKLESQEPYYLYPKDYTQAKNFLYSYRGSEATYNAYRRELERLLHWSSMIAKKPLKQLRRADIESFIAFCQKPPLHWIGTKNVARFIKHDGF